MIKPRVIPILLLKNGGLYKTLKFEKPKYVGDPLNAIKIFNEMKNILLLTKIFFYKIIFIKYFFIKLFFIKLFL